MEVAIPTNYYGIFVDTNYEVKVDSRIISKMLGIENKIVNETICYLLSDESGFSKDFRQANFEHVTDDNSDYYLLTRDGFIALLNLFEISETLRNEYISSFSEVDEHIRYLQTLKEQHPQLTEAIKSVHDEPEFYHYSDEMDMLLKIVVGKTAKEFRFENRLPNCKAICFSLTPAQNDLFRVLELYDIGFVIAVPDVIHRRQMLEYQAMKWKQNNNNDNKDYGWGLYFKNELENGINP